MANAPMSVDELKQMAATIRCDIIEMICKAEAGHPGGSLSAADIVTALYFRLMRLDPQTRAGPTATALFYPRGTLVRSGTRPWPNAVFSINGI